MGDDQKFGRRGGEGAGIVMLSKLFSKNCNKNNEKINYKSLKKRIIIHKGVKILFF